MANDASDAVPAPTVRGSGAAIPPPQVVIHQHVSLLGRFGQLLLALVVAMLIFLVIVSSFSEYFDSADKPQEKYHSLTRHATKKIAIISVSGAVLEGDGGFVKREIDRVKEDEDVVAVVLRIDSPGGTVTASDYLYHHLRELTEERKLPMVVSMGSVCASGGYYIAMAVGDQTDAIFAEPTTWTGSIGVIIPHYDLSGLLGRWNVTDDSIASGPLKQMGSPTRPMTEEARKLLQALVDESFAGFKEIVTAGRPKFKDDPQSLDAVATGQIFTAKQALERGLVDKLGFIEDAVGRAAELANYSTDELRCVKYKERPTFFDELLGARAPSASGYTLDPAAWLDLTAPRAYYLWTGLPAILSNTRPK